MEEKDSHRTQQVEGEDAETHQIVEVNSNNHSSQLKEIGPFRFTCLSPALVLGGGFFAELHIHPIPARAYRRQWLPKYR